MSEAQLGEPEVVLTRIARPAYLIGSLVLVVVMVAGAFAAGWNVQPSGTASDEAQAPVEVTAEVQLRVVQDGIQLPAKITDPPTIKLLLAGDGPLGAVAAPAPAQSQRAPGAAGAAGAATEGEEASTGQAAPGAERNVITKTVAAAGNQPAPGTLLAEVSGRPVIAVAPGTPLYRDFTVGITGEDVRAVQQLLADLGYLVNTDGVLDAGTMDTISYWYAQLGYELPKAGNGKGLPWRELLPLTSGKLTVLSPGGAGTVVDADHPLMTLRKGDPVIELTVDPVQAQTFRDAKTVYVLSGGESFDAAVLSIGALTTNEETGASGHTMQVSYPAQLAGSDAKGGAIAVASAKPEEPGPAVPVTAIQEDGKGQFVLLAEHNDEAGNEKTKLERGRETATRRVDIEVVAVVGGWAAITEHPDLPEGTKIRVG